MDRPLGRFAARLRTQCINRRMHHLATRAPVACLVSRRLRSKQVVLRTALLHVGIWVGVFVVAGCRHNAESKPTEASVRAAAVTLVGATTAEVGKRAPEFRVTNQRGEQLSLASLAGKSIVLYFYPRDETPGCTREACALRDNWSEIERTGAVVIGVSGDSADSHRAFADHHKLPFHLVTDDGTLAKAFGVGFVAGFASRQTIVIGANGIVRKIFREVNVGSHAADVLAALQ
jgi:thioredoxin-dependent peroxiredoxin